MYVCLHNCQGSYDALYPNSMSGNPFLDSEMALDIANALQIGEHRVIYQNRCARVGTDDMRASALVREIPLANSQQDIHIYFVLNSRCFTCSLKKALPCTSVWCADSHHLNPRITSDVTYGLLACAAVATRREYAILDEKPQIHQRTTVYRAHVFGTGRVPCTLVRDGKTVHAWV
jgi:hypothetical protein